MTGYAALGPVPCVGCRRQVIWERMAGSWWLGELAGDTIRHHACRSRCLSKMRGPAICARTKGHGGKHRSRARLDFMAAYNRAYYRSHRAAQRVAA